VVAFTALLDDQWHDPELASTFGCDIEKNRNFALHHAAVKHAVFFFI
jgi:hypothetical protein